MFALTVRPGIAYSTRVQEVPEPAPESSTLLVQTLAIGVCGTDHEIIQAGYGSPPPGQDFLILGHESLGSVLEAPAQSGFAAGDLVVGIVRRPDPVPCPNCAVGEWDMCRNGLYTEHGIKQVHGFGAERFRIAPHHAVKLPPSLQNVGVLLEPASVVAKAWEHIEKIGQRAAGHLAPTPCARHRCRADWHPGSHAGSPSGPGSACARPGDRGAKTRAGS